MNEPPALRVGHYQVWCGVALALIFLGQLSQGIVLTNVLAALVGVLGIVSRMRWGVFFLLAAVAFCQSLHFFLVERHSIAWGIVAGRRLDLPDFLLAVGTLGYVVGHYRLVAIWHHVWPPDTRQRAGPAEPALLGLFPRRPIVQHQRGEKDLRPAEIVTQAFLVPSIVVAAMVLLALTRPARGWLELPYGLGQFMALFLAMALLVWVVRHFMEFWRLAAQGPFAARLFLQDQLWAQVRGELRRIQRWRAWRRIEDGPAKPEAPSS